MATTFASGDCTVTGLIAALKEAIDVSSDWSIPAADRVTCTTTRGEIMHLNFSAAAAAGLTVVVSRNADIAVDYTTRYLQWRDSGGATSDTVHWVISAGKEHLFISIEGPRAGETNAVSTTMGTYRAIFWIGDLVPYHASDSIPATVLVAATATGKPDFIATSVSRNQANSSSWVSARLLTLTQPRVGSSSGDLGWSSVPLRATGDSKTYMWPYVVVEETDGPRGRVAKVFHLGACIQGDFSDIPPSLFSRYVYGSDTYITLPTTRSVSAASYSSFGGLSSTSSGEDNSVIAVPYS